MEYISLACDVLSAIEKTMDEEQFDAKDFTAERFGVSDWLFTRLMDDLNENGYIGGVESEVDVLHFTYGIRLYRPYLTLKGAEFLSAYSPDD